jgi:oxygen-dependent protoporphyrinogen oxidase
MSAHVVVVGAGIAGLSAAVTLQDCARRERTPLQLTVLDGATHSGGHAQTSMRDGFLVEAGPNGFLDRAPEARALVELAGVSPRIVEARPESRRRYILRRGRLGEVPDSPVSLLRTPLLSWRGRLRVLAEPFTRRRGDGDETVFEFARRHIGAEAAEVLVDTALAGISAGDSRRLSLAAQFPLMARMEREHGSLVKAMVARRRAGIAAPRLISFDGGMRTLVDALAGLLGPSLRLSTPVDALARIGGGGWRVLLSDGESIDADHVVLATPARVSASLVQCVSPELSAWLQGVTYAGVAVVSLGFRDADLPRPLDGYGYLVARAENLATLGVVWESSLFAGRAPEGHALLRVMLGGTRRPEVVGWPAERQARVAREELARVMGITADPVMQHVTAWPQAIAQYTIGHRERRAAIDTALATLPGLSLCGSSYDGVSFGEAIASGVTCSVRLRADLTRSVRLQADLTRSVCLQADLTRSVCLQGDLTRSVCLQADPREVRLKPDTTVHGRAM